MYASVRLSVSVCLVWSIGRALGDCVLPKHPAHGRHQAHGGDCGGADRHPACDGNPGTSAPEDWLLIVRCDPGYQPPNPEGADVPSICSNGVWSIPKLPACIIPDLITSERQRCTVPNPPPNALYRMFPEECGAETLPPGSPVPQDCILFLNCASGYIQRVGKGDFLTHCTNKTWSPSIPKDLCTPDPFKTGSPGTTSSPPPSSSTGCVLPNTSPNRRFCSLLNGCDATCNFDNKKCLIPPGSTEEQVKVACAPGYSTRNPSSSDIAICLANGLRWYPSLPECYKLCRPLHSEMLLLTCRLGTNIVDCSDWALPETTVSLECAPTFSEYPELRRAGVYRKVHSCNSNGEWSDSLPLCKAACGVFNSQVKEFSPTIIDGQNANLGFFPWHAGLYFLTEKNGKEFWEQKCGGSLINKRFVLTAAHCVKNVLKDVDTVRIALGKYYRSWYANERSEQKRNVLAITVPSQYALSTVSFDIALVLLSEGIKFGEYIMPACLDLDPEKNRFQDNNLYVVGWGKTSEGGSSSEVLLFNKVKAMTDKECRTSVPSFYNTFEKICARKENSASITQKGDSGGGLTAKYKDGLHYIIGIVSTKVDQVSIFTYIKWRTHIEWMESEMRRLEREYVRD